MDRVFKALGECGIRPHVKEKQLSIGEMLYVVANGGWYLILMNSPVPLFQITDIRRNTVPKLAVAGAATVFAAQQLLSRM
jgi:hypothetical protein